MKYKITLIPGDGIGPEVTSATLKVIEAAGLEVEWEVINAGADAFERYGQYLPDELMESIQRTRVAIKGPISTPIGKGFSSINVALRKALTLYANFRPIKNLPGVKTRFENVDIIVVGTDWARKDYYAQIDVTQDWLDERDIILAYVPYTEGVSTTKLIERIRDAE